MLAGNKPLRAGPIERLPFFGDISQAACRLIKFRSGLGQITGVSVLGCGLVALANLRNCLNQISFLAFQFRYPGDSFCVGCAIDSVEPFLCGNIGNLFGDYHVDGRKATELVATICARFRIKCDFSIGTLIIVTGEQLVASHLHPSTSHLASRMEELFEFACEFIERRRHTAPGRYIKIIARRH